jgi:phage/plasmid-associated DNA primase
MTNFITFAKEDLLTFDQLKQLMNASTKERSLIITSKLIKYIFYYRNVLYKFKTDIVIYEKIENKSQQDNELLTVISDYLHDSKALAKTNNPDEFSSDEFFQSYRKHFASMLENTFISKILPQLTVRLQQDNELFSPDFYQVHFRNGYIDIKTQTFKKREIGKDFVRAYIKRDYVQSSELERREILKQVSKIYSCKEDLVSILYILGSAITGKACKSQKLVFLLGEGSSGKSTILELTSQAIETYFQSLEEDAFSNSNKNKDKTFSTFADADHIRLIWTNEPKDDGMNVSTFKQFCEGKMQGKMLYKDGIHSFSHNGLGIFTSNTMPNIKIDSGVSRRIIALEHTSKFVEDRKKVNEAKHIYLKNEDFLEDMKRLLNAWIDILVDYGYKWTQGEQPELPESFKRCKDEIVDVNDIYQDMIDAKLVITGLSKDRIGKYRMEEIFKQMFPNRGTTQQIIRDKLREKKILYNKDLTAGNGDPRGVYVGIRERNCRDNIIDKDDNIVDDDEIYENPTPVVKNPIIKKTIKTEKVIKYNKDIDLMPDSILDNQQKELELKLIHKNDDSDCDDEEIELSVNELNCLLEF